MKVNLYVFLGNGEEFIIKTLMICVKLVLMPRRKYKMRKEFVSGLMFASVFFAFMIIGIYIIVNSTLEYPSELTGPIIFVAVSLFIIFIIPLRLIVKDVREKRKETMINV